MLRSQLLATVSSSELTDLMIMENLPYWEEKFKGESLTPEAQSKHTIATLFGSKYVESES